MTRWLGAKKTFKKPAHYTPQDVQPLFAFADDNQTAFDFTGGEKEKKVGGRHYSVITCRGCGQKFSVPSDFAGECPSCDICEKIREMEGKE